MLPFRKPCVLTWQLEVLVANFFCKWLDPTQKVQPQRLEH